MNHSTTCLCLVPPVVAGSSSDTVKIVWAAISSLHLDAAVQVAGKIKILDDCSFRATLT